MPNIHAINAQGTEYGITAENGVTQEQQDTIATIGDVADLTTTTKTDVVSAINEVDANTKEALASIGTLTDLTTETKADVVSAINEVKASIPGSSVTVWTKASISGNQSGQSIQLATHTRPAKYRITYGHQSSGMSEEYIQEFAVRGTRRTEGDLFSMKVRPAYSVMNMYSRPFSIANDGSAITVSECFDISQSLSSGTLDQSTDNYKNMVLKVEAIY